MVTAEASDLHSFTREAMRGVSRHQPLGVGTKLWEQDLILSPTGWWSEWAGLGYLCTEPAGPVTLGWGGQQKRKQCGDW